MIREAIRTVLLSDGPTSTGVGGSRIFPLIMPQGQRADSLVYQRASGTQDVTLDGPAGYRETRMQIDAWSEDADRAARLIELARDCLNGYTGTVPVGDDSPQAQIQIKGVFAQNEFDGYDQDSKLYRDGRDFRVLWCRVT